MKKPTNYKELLAYLEKEPVLRYEKSGELRIFCRKDQDLILVCDEGDYGFSRRFTFLGDRHEYTFSTYGFTATRVDSTESTPVTYFYEDGAEYAKQCLLKLAGQS